MITQLWLLTTSFPTKSKLNMPSTASILPAEDSVRLSQLSQKANDYIQKSVFLANLFANHHRIKRSAEEKKTDQRETFYKLTEYHHPNGEESRVIDSSSIYTTTSPLEGVYGSYKSYLETGYEDVKCKPESVTLPSDKNYLPDVVPGVRCDGRCSACNDGYTYQAVVYPMPTLKVHKIGTIQTYYKSTRLIPVYCACFRAAIADDDVTYSEDDADNVYNNFDSVEADNIGRRDPAYNEEDIGDVYDAFDSTSEDDTK